MDINNLTGVYNQNPTLQSQYTLQQYLDLFGGSSTGNTAQTQTTTSTTNANQGIINSGINQYQTGGGGGGGGGGNNTYMPNANVNTRYQPNYAYRQHVDYNPNWSSTMNQKQFDMNQNYYNKPTPTGLAKLMNKVTSFVPYAGAIKNVGKFIGGMLPVNQRAIFENELRGSGVFTDDIGRIAIGPGGSYNTPEGIMAGYNANQMTEKTFNKRTDKISETLGNKYGISTTDIQGIIDGTFTDEDVESKYGITTNLTSNLKNIELAKSIFTKKKKVADAIAAFELQNKKIAKANKISKKEALAVQQAIHNQGKESAPGRGDAGNPGGSSGAMTEGPGGNVGTYCFDPSTPIQMADGSTKEIKNIQLGDATKGGEVTGVFQFKATDEIHDYKGVTVAGSHYVKEDGRFIMVQDSPLSVKIDKIPVVYSLDTKGRRIFINDIEFADYNGDGVAKNFLNNAGVDLTGFDKEVLRQVEHRLI